MKTMTPNINIIETEESMDVEDFRAVKQPMFPTGTQKDNWEKMTGISADELDWLLIMGKVNGETVSTKLRCECPLTTKQMEGILRIVHSCKGEQITERFDRILKERLLSLLDPEYRQASKVEVGYDFDMGLIAGIYICPDWKKISEK